MIVLMFALAAAVGTYSGTVHHCANSADGCKAEAAKLVPADPVPSDGG